MDRDVDVVIDVASIIPISEQIRSQIADAIRAGRLADGMRLPTVRALASDLGVAVNTVNKAYSELDRDGLIVSRRRLGTRVTRPAGHPAAGGESRRLASLLAETVRMEGLDEETAVAIVRDALRNASGPVDGD